VTLCTTAGSSYTQCLNKKAITHIWIEVVNGSFTETMVAFMVKIPHIQPRFGKLTLKATLTPCSVQGIVATRMQGFCSKLNGKFEEEQLLGHPNPT
jgi:hypothetical protein